MTEKLKLAYTALPRVTPPHATNCLLERMGGTSPARPGPKRAADGMAGFPESSETTSPLRVTSYWGPDGSTKMVRRLEHRKDRKRSEPRLWGDTFWLHRTTKVGWFTQTFWSRSHIRGLFINTRIGVLLWVMWAPVGELQLREEHVLGNKCMTIEELHLYLCHKLQT